MIVSKEIEEKLKTYYRESAPQIDAEAKQGTLIFVAEVAGQQAEENARLVEELVISNPVTEERSGFWRFAFGQLRFIRIRTWIMQLALIALMLLISLSGITPASLVPVVSCLIMLSVLICMPEVFKSFEENVAELEFASKFNCVQVLTARMALFGMSDIVWLSVAIFVVPTLSGCDAFQIMLFSCIPFFLSCGGCFWIVRVRPQNMVASCTLLIVLLIAANCLAWVFSPYWHGLISSAVWAGLLILSIAFAAYEISRVLRDASTGLDRFVSSNA